ncbi:MAG: sugar transferase [Ruminococcaceae bacterium]|nr:sugar transferase [Oscillospiraceae bacterium]
MYAKCIKRVLDFILSLLALLILSPILLILIVIGAIAMKGNPFFTQLRPGKINPKTGEEKIFRLLKFRTMSNAKDKEGNLLPDDQRLNRYGKFLRSTSLDELPELLNILVGDMAIVGPRPLLVKYLPLYNEEQRHRHDVRPGLTGYAQVHGRNTVSWEEKFAMDVTYVRQITFGRDVKIILDTVGVVLRRKGITSDTSVSMEEFTGTPAMQEEMS